MAALLVLAAVVERGTHGGGVGVAAGAAGLIALVMLRRRAAPAEAPR